VRAPQGTHAVSCSNDLHGRLKKLSDGQCYRKNSYEIAKKIWEVIINMFDDELNDFLDKNNVRFSILDKDIFNKYAKIENYPFTGSRISWSKLKIHISKSFHELPKFINEVSHILSSLNENQSNIILIGNDFQNGYYIDFSIKNLELISHFLMEYPGENYLFGLNQKWCICIYDVLNFGLPEPKLS
jgi:hypothetical protein